MSENQTAKLREMQRRIETAAASATTRSELVNLRALWGDLEEVLRLDNGTATE